MLRAISFSFFLLILSPLYGLQAQQLYSDNGGGTYNKLWYNKPATQWVEALPVGNGRLGAMVYG
ncbi:MAG TPA: glycoside hydrolase N-terminal domain-containing protein, partial [Bacteroidales bacterium]|nr:glycoside hydrolase N-terminal domain-containing protein [Bacteroidales bacterium]